MTEPSWFRASARPHDKSNRSKKSLLQRGDRGGFRHPARFPVTGSWLDGPIQHRIDSALLRFRRISQHRKPWYLRSKLIFNSQTAVMRDSPNQNRGRRRTRRRFEANPEAPAVWRILAIGKCIAVSALIHAMQNAIDLKSHLPLRQSLRRSQTERDQGYGRHQRS